MPVLQLEGGRKLVFEGSFSAEREVAVKRGFWKSWWTSWRGHPSFITWCVRTAW